jgi:hypothetical protein
MFVIIKINFNKNMINRSNVVLSNKMMTDDQTSRLSYILIFVNVYCSLNHCRICQCYENKFNVNRTELFEVDLNLIYKN